MLQERDGGNAIIPIDPAVWHAQRVIESTYGDIVSVEQKAKDLVKFGRNNDIGTTEEMVWLYGGTETLATGNDIDTVSSSNAGDTQEVKIEGHTVANNQLSFVVQTATLNGQNKVTLTTPLYRATRIYNNDSTDLAGTVYVYEDDTLTGGVPDTAAKVHLSGGADNQSLKAATSVSNNDYWIITQLVGSVDRQNSRSVDFRFQVREYGKVFRTKYGWNCHSQSGTREVPLPQPIIVKKNSDVRIMATSSGTTTGVRASAHGYLATVIETA